MKSHKSYTIGDKVICRDCDQTWVIGSESVPNCTQSPHEKSYQRAWSVLTWGTVIFFAMAFLFLFLMFLKHGGNCG